MEDQNIDMNSMMPQMGSRILAEAQSLISRAKGFGLSTGSISDGYHTFDELYKHRITLFKALCKSLFYSYDNGNEPYVWKAKLHHDGSSFDGWFIAGIGIIPGEQITYHLPMSEWESLHANSFDKAPCEFDGHTSTDVLKRLAEL